MNYVKRSSSWIYFYSGFRCWNLRRTLSVNSYPLFENSAISSWSLDTRFWYLFMGRSIAVTISRTQTWKSSIRSRMGHFL